MTRANAGHSEPHARRSAREDEMKKRINILRLCSGLLAAVTLFEWTILGFATPVVRAMLADFDVHPDAMAWPYPHVLSLHWSWTPIVGLILAAGLILKDRLTPRAKPIVLNCIAAVVIIGVYALWIWGTVPHRMIQTVN